MKTRNDQIDEGLAYRIDEIDKNRSHQLGYATSLYVNENMSSDQYLLICDQINKHYNDLINSSNKLADKIRSEH